MAYCLNEAVAYFGNFVKAELEAVEGKNRKSIEGKQEALLRRLLAEPDKVAKQFAVPQATISREEFENRKEVN